MLPSPLCDKEFEEMLKECQPGEVERSVDGIALSPSVAQKYGAKAFTAVSLLYFRCFFLIVGIVISAVDCHVCCRCSINKYS